MIIFDLMDFDCDQRNNVHFIYTLPFKKIVKLIETTWFSKYDKKLKDYQKQKNILGIDLVKKV